MSDIAAGHGAIPEVTLETTRLRLRPLLEKDLDRLCALAGAAEVYRTTINIPHPYTRADAEAWLGLSRASWREGTGTPFAIALRESDELIGGVGLILRRAHDRAELGFWVGVPYWGRGFTTEAARAVVDHGFRELGLVRVWAGHFAGNEASGRVQQKLGMIREGVLRKQLKKDGAYVDDVVYAITREEWERRSAGRGVPTLETRRLVLRALGPGDLDALVELNRHKEVADGVLTLPHPYTRADGVRQLGDILGRNARGESCDWLMTLRGSGEGVGMCGFVPDDAHGRAVMGYTLRPDHWNKGLVTEALRAVLAFAFGRREPTLHRVMADHYPENPASGRVCEKLGMSREGTMRGFLRKDGEFRDAVRWAILRGDWMVMEQ